MYRTTLATSLLAAAVLAGNAVPAQAAGVPVADALAEINGITRASQAAALAEGFTAVTSDTLNASQAFTLTTSVDRAGNQRTVADGAGIGGSFDSLTVAGVGSWIGLKGDLFGSFFGRSALKPALKYLGKSDADYVFMADPQAPKANAETTGFTSLPVDLTTKTIATVDKSAFGDSGGVRYSLVTKRKPKEPASTITIDVVGERIVAESAEEDGIALTVTWNYGSDDIAAPSEAESVTFEQLIPALEAAALPSTLKGQARRIVKQVKASARKQHGKVSAARIRHYSVAVAKKANADGRGIRTHAGKVKNGARIFARNPYTHKIVAYKITVVGGKVQVSRA
jgi:hypothetical protein